ncbi:tetratricopeptide repeat protein [Candidatus Riflebacteria bacterium]
MNESSVSFQGAVTKLKEGKFQEAEDDFYRLIDIEPDNLEYTIYLTVAHFNQGEFAEALDALKKVRKFHPENMILLNYLAQASLRMNYYNEALVYLDESLALVQGDAQSLYLKGIVYRKRQQPELAEESFTRAIKSSPAPALRKKIEREIKVLAAAKKKMADEKAKGTLETVKEPEIAELRTFYENGEYLKVIQLYHQLGKNLNTEACYYAACAFLGLHSRKCEDLFKICIKEDIFPLTSNYHLALLYEGLGEYEKAENHYTQCLKKDSNYFPAAFNLGCIFLKMQQNQKAQEYFNDLKQDLEKKGDSAATREKLVKIQNLLTNLS